MSNFNTRIKLKRDTAVNWTVNNPVLLNGEIILVDTDNSQLRAKIGDGSKTYNQLPFTDEILRNLITNKQDKITGQEGQIVQINSSGSATVTDNISLKIGVVSNSEIPENLTGPLTFIFDEDEASNSDELTTLLNGKQDKLTGNQGQVVGFDSSGNAIAQAAPSGLPSGATNGQFLTYGNNGAEWTNLPSDLPSGGSTGKVLGYGSSGAEWIDIPSGLPDGGVNGKILGYGASGPEWIDPPTSSTTPAAASFVIQSSAPSDTNVLWINSTEHSLSYYDGSNWVKIVGVWG